MGQKKRPAARSAGKERGGNVVLDLGEEVERAIGTAVEAGYTPSGLGAAGRKGRSFSPIMGSAFRPGLSWRPGVHRSKLGAALDMPISVDPMKLLGGALTGLAANRILYRLTPYITKLDRDIYVQGLNAIVGALPFFFRKNSFTVGFAIPGVLSLGGSIVDLLLQAVNAPFLPKPSLRGTLAGSTGGQGLSSARQALEQIRNRIGSARQQGFSQLPRVPARVAV